MTDDVGRKRLAKATETAQDAAAIADVLAERLRVWAEEQGRDPAPALAALERVKHLAEEGIAAGETTIDRGEYMEAMGEVGALIVNLAPPEERETVLTAYVDAMAKLGRLGDSADVREIRPKSEG